MLKNLIRNCSCSSSTLRRHTTEFHGRLCRRFYGKKDSTETSFVVSWRSIGMHLKSVLIVSGSVGEAFELSRSVRQGYPLAPFLFIVVLDALRYMFANPRYKVEGFTLPGGSTVIDASFADKTSLFLKGQKENLERARAVLETYCLASGSKLNWTKIYGIWTARRDITFDWGEDMGVTWVPKGEGIRYLGR